MLDNKPTLTTDKKPSVHILNDRTFIWDANSAIILRRDYRIVGSLIGTLPRLQSQNIFLGLPIELSIEDVNLLLSKNAVDLIDDVASLRTPNEKDMKVLEEQYLAEYQIYLSQRAKVAEIRSIKGRELHATRMKKDNSNKIQKRQKSTNESLSNLGSDLSLQCDHVPDTENNTAGNSSSFGDSGTLDDATAMREAIIVIPETIQPTSSSPTKLTRKPLPTLPPPPVSTFTGSSPLPWYNPKPLSPSQIPSKLTTPTLNSKIFTDLWNRGYYIAAGSKFGGKWLVYPGDPMRYHSSYVVNILSKDLHDCNGGSDMKELVSGGRLGGAVKKQYVLASWDDSKDEAIYFCVEWTGWL